MALIAGTHYEGDIIRPPNEADSLLLQAAVGCSHNKCTFCGAYKDKRFRIKDEAVVFADIAHAAERFTEVRRVFLTDGDALIIPMARLTRLLEEIRARMPWVRRVGVYGNAKSILLKSPEELAELRRLGLGIVHLGLESGDPEVLREVRKGVSPERAIEAGRRVIDAGIKLSVTVLLGLAGRERSLRHARATGEALTRMDPNFVGALTYMPLPNTGLGQRVLAGEFQVLDPGELLLELREMLDATTMTRGQFLSNHASNYLPLRVRLPRGKEEAIKTIDRALAGMIRLRPEEIRRL